jgi:peptide-methionine (S)-S-oxide reductase
MSLFTRDKTRLPTPEEALPGRPEPTPVPERHEVLGTPLAPPFPEGLEVAVFAMGCFWGSEELYWQVPGVWSTAVAYVGGLTPNPTYEEVCTGRTGHAEAVQVVFDPTRVSYEDLLRVFWEHHDPTSGMRQGNDIGTQYRSAIFPTTPEQQAVAIASRSRYAEILEAAGLGEITTEVSDPGPIYLAEAYHQQYLHKNPNGYRCHAATGIPYPA